MERADLELVVAIARSGSLTGASRLLHTAQPALSRRLAHLEHSVGAPLFVRGRHGATPTPAGRVLIERAEAALAEGIPLYRAGLDADQQSLLGPSFLLTNKPVLIVVNVGDDQLDQADGIAASVREAAGVDEVVAVCGQLEMETAGLEREERQEMLEGLGLGEGVIPRVARAAYHLLGRRTFLTTGEKESRAWTFPAGATAPECAGVIHSDLQRGFIRAEVVPYEELIEIGSWARAKELGKLRLEGKDYVVQDGDVLEIRFNV